MLLSVGSPQSVVGPISAWTNVGFKKSASNSQASRTLASHSAEESMDVIDPFTSEAATCTCFRPPQLNVAIGAPHDTFK